MVIQTGVSIIIFSKMNVSEPVHQEKQLTMFAANDTI